MVRPRAALLLTLCLLVGLLLPAGPARADSSPTTPGEPATVTADPLPTVQINGVVWSQVVVGNTVYAAGNFTSARPAGNAPGVGEVARTHLLAYDIRTGVLDPGFAPVLDGQVLAITKSPDNSRIYIGGEFTRIDGTTRPRVAAFTTGTRQLVAGFAPVVGSVVRTLTATDSAVYFGGDFVSVGGASRTYAAAVGTAGNLLPWNPAPNAPVSAITANPSRSKIVLGGRFTRLSGATVTGLGAVDPVSGASRPWAIGSLIKNYGDSSSITSLAADGDSVYGTGYGYGGGNFEGTFRANGETGAVEWINDCNGDHYSVFPAGDVVYSSSHAHYCGNIPDGFLEPVPRVYYHSTAVTKAVAGSIVRIPHYSTYGNFSGEPAPKMLHWYPIWTVGSFTGQQQAGWHVSGDSDYVLYGGEFKQINGKAQQGLVRFARTGLAINKAAPQGTNGITPSAVSIKSGEVQVGWQATFDRDSRDLSYRLYRNFTTFSTPPIYTTTVKSTPWDRPTITFTDTGLTPGSTQRYRLYVFDQFGNNITRNEASVVVAGSSTQNPYGQAVIGSGAEHWFRLNEPSGTILNDSRGSAHATGPAAFTRGAAGISGGSDTATTFDGTANSYASTEVSQPGPQTFSVEAWFKTNTTTGGRIVGFSETANGLSRDGRADRHIYLDNAGRVVFGVTPLEGVWRSTASAPGFNDNKWHHAVATLNSSGMRLYIDGSLAASRTDTTSARILSGMWRIGGDRMNAWPNRPTSNAFKGTIDEVAIYHRVLSAAEIANHFAVGTGAGSPPAANTPPTASFTTSATGLTVSVNGTASSDPGGSVASYSWNFGDGSPAVSGATQSRTYASAGTYTITLTVTDNAGATGATTRSVTVAPAANTPPTASFTTSATGLTVSVNGTASSDPGGSVASYSWNFGDGSPAVSGATQSRTYASAGTYTITLTVTDNAGATGATTRSVTVAGDQAAGPFAADSFSRTASAGWGAAETGGNWTVSGPSANYSVSAGNGRQRVDAPAKSTAAYLNGVSQLDQDIAYTFSLDKLSDGGGTFLTTIVRGGSSNGYRAKLWVKSTGAAQLQVIRAVSGTETVLATTVMNGLTLTPGARVNVRVQAIGSSPTTVRAKVWADGTAEPAAWGASATDSTAGLQSPGGLGVMLYVSGTATNAPITLTLDDLSARKP